jgi:cytochrome c oxidase subunit 1
MIMATIIMVTGPFGNFILPIMIGARDMAFPRLNALSFWLLGAAVPCMLAAGFMGGIPTGWSAYSPLSDQSTPGMDGYLIAIIVFAISSAVAGANITTTVLTMRARGMTWNRTPIFVYGVVASVGLALPALPMFMTSQILLALDRSMEGQFYVASGGGSPWLYQNLFWLFGHPEVYVIVIPAVVALMEITPVFARKPLYNFNAAVLGIVGITGLGAPHVRLRLGAGPERTVHADHRVDLGADRRPVPGRHRDDLAGTKLDDRSHARGLRDAVELHHRRHYRHLPV